jgi:hypothetical protein
MSADIDISEVLWLTVRANNTLELTMSEGGDVICVAFDPKVPEDRQRLELLQSTIQRCLLASSTLYEGDI